MRHTIIYCVALLTSNIFYGCGPKPQQAPELIATPILERDIAAYDTIDAGIDEVYIVPQSWLKSETSKGDKFGLADFITNHGEGGLVSVCAFRTNLESDISKFVDSLIKRSFNTSREINIPSYPKKFRMASRHNLLSVRQNTSKYVYDSDYLPSSFFSYTATNVLDPETPDSKSATRVDFYHFYWPHLMSVSDESDWSMVHFIISHERQLSFGNDDVLFVTSPPKATGNTAILPLLKHLANRQARFKEFLAMPFESRPSSSEIYAKPNTDPFSDSTADNLDSITLELYLDTWSGSYSMPLYTSESVELLDYVP